MTMEVVDDVTVSPLITLISVLLGAGRKDLGILDVMSCMFYEVLDVLSVLPDDLVEFNAWQNGVHCFSENFVWSALRLEFLFEMMKILLLNVPISHFRIF